METMRSLVSLAVCLCALSAQEPSKTPDSAAPQTAIRARTQEVLLDMVVRDKKGGPLTDLTANNVQILDEGTPGKIMGLRLVSGGDAAGLGPQGANDPPRHARLVSLVFEKLDAEERRFARQAALDFLADDLEDNVYLAVFVADPRLRVIQPFSNDHNLVRQAVEQASTAEYAQLAAQSEAIRKKLEDASAERSTGRRRSAGRSGCVIGADDAPCASVRRAACAHQAVALVHSGAAVSGGRAGPDAGQEDSHLFRRGPASPRQHDRGFQ